MATEINKIVLKRGTTAKALAYTGPVGEVVVDTGLRSLRVQDNVTPGGVLLSKDGHQHAIGDMTGLQAALDAKAPLASPTLTGVPLAPTAAAGTNTTQIATTAFVAAALASGVSGNAATASKLQTARTISLVGDVTGSVSFDGSTNVSLTATVDNDSHQHTFSNLLGLPTTLLGYGITDAQPLDADLTAIAALAVPGLVARTGNGTAAARTLSASGTGITVTNGDGAAGNPTVVSNATDANTAGTIVARDASGNFSAGTISAALTGNASTATALRTARTISLSGDSTGSVSFNGTTNAQINVTLANSGVGAGTYRSVTVDAKGRVTAGTNPTTLSGYGITDAQPLDADLTAIAALAGTTGFLKKTAADTWTLDTNTYLTGNQSITVSGDASGSGTTAISLTLANVVTAGTATKVTYDAKGRVTAGASLAASDIPNLNWSKITSGKPTTLSGYGITDGVNTSDVVTAATANKILKLDANSKLPASITGNADGNAATATKLATARSIAMTGDVSWSISSFDGSGNVTAAATLANVVTAGTGTKVTYNAKGLVTGSSSLAASDIPNLDWSKITSGKPTTLAGYGITDAQSFITAGTTAQYYRGDKTWATLDKAAVGLNNVENIALSTWAGSSNLTTAGALTAASLTVTGNLTINGTTTTVNSTVTTIDDPVITLGGDTAPTMDDGKDRGIEFRWHNGTTAKVGFFGFDDSTGKLTFIPDATNTSEVFTGTKGTIDAYLAWSDVTGKPTTVSGYGITNAMTTAHAANSITGFGTSGTATTVARSDHNHTGVYQPLDGDLTAIAGLAGTSGLLKKTAADTWTLDTSAYITGNQNITVSGDATGSGSTAISLTLANSGVTAGTYNNSATAITPITVDAKGRVTGTGAAVTITPAWGSITGKPTTLAGYGITDAVLASSYSANDVLAKLKTVHGAGSGLDADTIDGVESSALARITVSGLLAPVSGNLVIDCRDGAV